MLFRSGLVKAGKGDGFRRIVNNEVTASGSFQSADVAALAANDGLSASRVCGIFGEFVQPFLFRHRAEIAGTK